MKRLIIILVFAFSIFFLSFSSSYLLKPVQVTINLEELASIPTKTASVFFKAKWGKEPSAFGINTNEWLPGPMSLASDEQDSLYILDQENYRIQKFRASGKFEKIIPIDSKTYEDLAVADGFIYLLDPVENRLVKKISSEGKVIKTYPIAYGIEPITGLFIADNQIYVEVNHNKSYRLGTETKALSNERKQIESESEGQPAEDFKTIAWLAEDGEVKARIEGKHPLDFLKITGPLNIYSIVSIDVDRQDNFYITLNIAKSESQFNQGRDKLLGLVIGTDGQIKYKFYASNDYYTSHFRKVAVSPNGIIYQMQTTADGVVVFKWD